MYLHKNRTLFEEVIIETNNRTGIAQSIIEKDYYVTMILKLLEDSCPSVVFKGGTSLSKCFHLINRFSEDIDISFSQHLGESKRKKLKYNILKPISEKLDMPIENWNHTQSDRDYNYYLYTYQPITDNTIPGFLTSVRLETSLITLAFPTEEKSVNSIIFDALNTVAPDIINDYELNPFTMNVQSITRTYIDKIFALCDYYMQGKINRFSRHLYDIYKIYPLINVDESFMKLVEIVREYRSKLSMCPSANENADIKKIIAEFINNDFYEKDYNTLTKVLITDDVTYEDTISVLKEIAVQLFD